MIQSHSPSAIATAPEIPSSSNMAAYYDPRSSASYYQQVNSTPNQQMYMSPSTHPSAAAAAAAAAAAGLSSTSLPPLSQLLPPPTAPIESSNPASNSQSQTVTSKADPHHHHHHHQMQHNSMNAPSNTTPDYFNSQAPMSERSNRSMSAAPFAPGTQQEMTFRKSIDGQRPMYPPTVTNDLSRRSYISTHDTPENYYLLQQQQHPHHPSGEPHSIPQYPPQHPHHPNTAVVPSSDLSMFSTPHPALSQYHRAPHYHLPSPPTSVIDGVLMTDPHSMQGGINANNQKVFSFVPLPGLNQKKRPRRKYHEVERLYRCNFQECNKSYGTLNHLNAHVSMQRHGPKRQPSEFKELRKMWRKQKRENKQRNAAAAAGNGRCSSVSSIESPHQIPSDDDLMQKNDLCDYSSMQHYQPSLLSHSSPWHPSSQPGYMPTY